MSSGRLLRRSLVQPGCPAVYPPSSSPSTPGWELGASLATLLLTSERAGGEASPHHAAATVSPLPSFQSPLGGSGCGQELYQAALDVLHGTPLLKRSIAAPFLHYLACGVALPLSEAHPLLHTAMILHWIPSSCIPALWLEWAERAPCQLCFVACVWTAAVGKASKGRENNPLPAPSASFTSLHEAEQKISCNVPAFKTIRAPHFAISSHLVATWKFICGCILTVRHVFISKICGCFWKNGSKDLRLIFLQEYLGFCLFFFFWVGKALSKLQSHAGCYVDKASLSTLRKRRPAPTQPLPSGARAPPAVFGWLDISSVQADSSR